MPHWHGDIGVKADGSDKLKLDHAEAICNKSINQKGLAHNSQNVPKGIFFLIFTLYVHLDHRFKNLSACQERLEFTQDFKGTCKQQLQTATKLW